ncbi:futalosine hydrolase [Desulfotalea psychrophila]|nr:futalosine hydrolase [Desulfotalea psychrophila]
MFLVVCATEFEMQALTDLVPSGQDAWISLLTGVGVVETVLTLSRFLEQHENKGTIRGVLNFGVAGAYLCDNKGSADLLDICLAEREVFGDFGICHADSIEPLAEHLVHRTSYNLDVELFNKAYTLLSKQTSPVRVGNFVTVCGVSGTKSRGNFLCSQYNGLCENMEGAAVARVCEEFNLPLLEVRTISNFVEDRDLSRWKLSEACTLAGKAAAILLKGLTEE